MNISRWTHWQFHSPCIKASFTFFFFFLSSLSHNLSKYPNYRHCSSHIFVTSPEKSPKNTLPTRPFGPETTCSSSPWKTGLQIGHKLGKATGHQLSLASSRKHQLGDSRHPSKGMVPSGPSESGKSWGPYGSVIRAGTVQTRVVSKTWELMRPAGDFPTLVLWCPLRWAGPQPRW